MPEEDTEEKANTCRLALKAALDAITDYCGLAPSKELEEAFGEAFGTAPRSIEIENVRVNISAGMIEVAENQELTPDERIAIIKKLRSTQKAAKDLCEEVFKSTGAELEKCTDSISTKIAERVVRLVEVH